MIEAYQIINSGTIPEILLHGNIGAWQQTDSKKFITDFKNLEANNKQINIRINSTGGDCFAGISIFNCIKNSKALIHTFVDGVAASMASVIALAGKRIFMSKYAQLMIHRVSGSVSNSDSEKLRETAQLMDELQNSLIQIYSEKTGISQEEIKNKWMQRGQEKWVNANEALELKLVDEIYDGPVKSIAPINNSPEQAWDFYNQKFQTIYSKNTQMENINEILSFLNLRDDTTSAAVIAHLQGQKNEIENLKTEIEILQAEKVKFQNLIEQENKNKIQNLLDTAIKEKRINEANRNVYLTLAEANFDACKIAIQSIQPYKSITSQLQAEIKNEDELKTFEDYRKKNPAALKAMKENNPDKFIELYQAQYGTKPKLNLT